MKNFNIFAFLLTFSVSFTQAFYIHENANSCVDSCGATFETQFSVNLKTGKYELKDDALVELVEQQLETHTDECDANAVLRVPMFDMDENTIVKIELDYGHEISGLNLHVGNSPTNELQGGDENSTIYNAQLFFNGSSLYMHQSSKYLCDTYKSLASTQVNELLFNETKSYLYSNQRVVLYVANKWLRIDNLETNASNVYNGDYLFRFTDLLDSPDNCGFSNEHLKSSYLYIGLNRAINKKAPHGAGLCEAKVSLMSCYSNAENGIDVDVKGMNFLHYDNESIQWVETLRFLEPTPEHSPCSGEAVLKLRFDPLSDKKIARFDFELGDIISGFTFNLGDSPTNNAYGGDAGTTSNSAEVHSNDNRFYAWLSPKYCGDTLLHKIEYGVFNPRDLITVFVSDQRLEITNNRDYHDVIINQYLYNLNGQNVTCNCFDTRCYPGILPDDDLYLGINRVIGGTYRPGVGVCRAKVSWLQCKNNIRRKTIVVTEEMTTPSTTTPTTTSTTTSTTTTTEETTSTSTSTSTTETTTQPSTTTIEATTTTTTTSITETKIESTTTIVSTTEALTTSLPSTSALTTAIKLENTTISVNTTEI